MEPDYFLASFFLWPLILKIIPALLLISNLCSRPVQQKLCYFFYFMSLWSMVALQDGESINYSEHDYGLIEISKNIFTPGAARLIF